MMNNTNVLYAALVSAALTLSGCGGGGGGGGGGTSSDTNTPVASALSGTAAVGQAVANATVTASCKNNTGFAQTVTTGADGKWSGTLNNTAEFPCALRVSGGTPSVTLYSYATSAGTVNITPLTDLSLALATNGLPQAWFGSFDGSAVPGIATQSTSLLTSLASNGFTVPNASTDIFTAPFDANHQGWDKLLDEVGQTLSASGESYQDLLNEVIQNGVTSLPRIPEKYNIIGNIAGATGTVSWQLLINNAEHATGNNGVGNVTFGTAIVAGSDYLVNVTASPAGQNCSLQNAAGTVSGLVENITIECSGVTAPSNTLIDLSQLNLVPVMPTDITPSAPTVTPINTSPKLADLFAQLGNAEKASLVKPSGTLSKVGKVDLVDGYIEYTSDESWYRETKFTAGADGIPNTEDDEIEYYSVYPQGKNSVRYRFGSPGNDGVWFTADDLLDTDTMGQPIYFPASGSLLEFESASEGAKLVIPCLSGGADNLPFTADDTVPCTSDYQVVVVDGEGNRAQVVSYYGTSSYHGAGPDGLWFTEDDVIRSYTLVGYNNAGKDVTAAVYTGPGDDGQWFTADDKVSSYTFTKLAANYQPLYTATFDSAGTDEEWYTSDDRMTSLTYYALDTDGNAALTVTSISKGADGLWLTDDDRMSAIFHVKQAQNDGGYAEVTGIIGNPNDPNAKSQGNDGLWLTADDQINSYDYQRFDANGNLVTRFTVNGKGGDDAWFTLDDQIAGGSYTQNVYDSSNQLVVAIQYKSSLNPSAELFADEQIESYRLYYDDGEKRSQVLVRKDTFWDANFGDDGLAFTSDDNVIYSKTATPGRVNFHKGAATKEGPQFGSSDPLVQYTETTNYPHIDILRKGVSVASDGSEVVSYCDSYVAATSQVEHYLNGDCGTGTLSSYDKYTSIVDGADTVVTKISYNAAGEEQPFSKEVKHYDTQDNLILEDYSHYAVPYYIRYDYNDHNELTTKYQQHPGDDGLLGTADDVAQSVEIFILNDTLKAAYFP